ncbi:MAG: deiodinase family protein [Planctomycetota bacterium]|nr:deiodinase family protein [Planctomycetota bacterium]
MHSATSPWAWLLAMALLGMVTPQFLSADDQPGAGAKSDSPETTPTGETDAEVIAKFGVPLAEIEKAYDGRPQPEAVRMLIAITRGSQMGPGEGWFGPASSRYSFEWLAKHHDKGDAQSIAATDFRGAANWLARLDRNHDGAITPQDLDWSDDNPWVQQAYMVNRLFRRMDPNGDGGITKDEWEKFFLKAAKGSDILRSDDLVDTLLAGVGGSFSPGDAPSPEVLIRGLFAGEIGSLNEGPQVGQQAPDFTLKTHDGEQTIHLADVIGKRPIVLTFGNFTCGPFRSMYPGVEAVYRRFHEEATFLSVYVREAHPTDGWNMESNSKVGVTVAQPKNYIERVAVANKCYGLLKCSMPLLVDEINDPVGNAYSGMPARLYVIDTEGKVAFKSGRGPFGFKTGEMEQALIMCLLECQIETATEPKAPDDAKPAKPAK